MPIDDGQRSGQVQQAEGSLSLAEDYGQTDTARVAEKVLAALAK